MLCAAAWTGFAQTPEQVSVEKDVVYGHADGVDLKLDLAKPPSGDGPFPAVVCIHGGAWQMGDKNGYEGLIRQLATQGYVAAAVEYRLAPKQKWPAQIEDCKCAVRYLRAHAKELKIDAKKFGALGDSAGGHLSLLLGLMDATDGLEGNGGNPEQPSKVQAVVNLYGPSDLRTWVVRPDANKKAEQALSTTPESILEDFLGTSNRESTVMAKASPITYINAGDPPILTFHGAKDDIVPIEQAKTLHAALEKAGIAQKLVVVEDAGHGWGGAKRVSTAMQSVAFFDAQLKASAPAPKQGETGQK
jgi:acetyl esterase/lipase